MGRRYEAVEGSEMTDIVERLRAAPCDIGGDHPDLHEQAHDVLCL
jgi:hypothetical protein